MKDKVVFSDYFNDKVSNLWHVYYITLAFAGIILTIFFGSWLFTKKRSSQRTEPVKAKINTKGE